MINIKTMSFLFFVLLFISCGKSESGHNEFVDAEELLDEQSEEVSAKALTFQVDAEMFGFSDKQEDKIRKASELIRQVIVSKEFKKRVLNYSYNGRKAFEDNKGLTNYQVYKRILEGREQLSREGKNRTMDLEIELYSDMESNTIGYTYPNIVRIFMNAKYFNRFGPHQVADNMMHEWLHKLGFGHDAEATPERRHSIPYAVGYIVRDLARKISLED